MTRSLPPSGPGIPNRSRAVESVPDPDYHHATALRSKTSVGDSANATATDRGPRLGPEGRPW